MKTKRGIVLIFSGLVVMALILFLSVVYIGVYDIGVPSRHSSLTENILKTTMRNSVRYHARYIEVPDTLDLNDREYARNFFGHYNAACLPCHGAPGKDPVPWMVIYPEAPLLSDPGVIEKWSDTELFWLLKNGVKSTGMMALGPTHPDEAIWGITALTRQLPEMTAEEYQAMQDWFEQLQQQKMHKQ